MQIFYWNQVAKWLRGKLSRFLIQQSKQPKAMFGNKVFQKPEY